MNKLILFVKILLLMQRYILAEEITGDSEWKAFKATYKKSYDSEIEENFRLMIYKENIQKINEHNQLYDLGEVSFTLKENQFADLLESEFIERLNGFDQRIQDFNDDKVTTYIPPANVEVLADTVDWRDEGAVTEVKDQGQCGSCWSFSATGSLEGQNFIKSGNLISLSEQDIMDCCKDYNTYGCEGGTMNNAFICISNLGGIEAESTYPYQAEDISSCRYISNRSVAIVTGYKSIEFADEHDLQIAVTTVGPVSVGIDAGHSSFQFYSDGVYYEPSCSSTHLNHGVLAVGYGYEGTFDYWIIKNSWGTIWGSEGYIKMSKDRDNNCGIASMASYPLV